MQFKRLVLAAIIGLMAVVVLTGCGRNTVASINGNKITKDEFYRRLETMPLGGNPAGAIVLDQMINEKLFTQLAKDRGVEPTDQQIDRKIALARKEGVLTNTLNQRGITLDDYKKELRTQQSFLNLVTKGVKVTDAEIQKYYEQNKKTLYTKPERTQIGAIICKTRDKIEKADSQLKQRQDFSTVALNLSDDEVTRRGGGTLGWIWHGQQGVPATLVDAAFKLKVNAVSEPILVKQPEGGDQWVIVKALDRKQQTVLNFADVKEQIREGLAFAKAQQQSDIGAVLKKARDSAKIKVKSDRYKGLEKANQAKNKKK